MDRRVGNKPELNRTAISWKCAPIVPAFVFSVSDESDAGTYLQTRKCFERRSVLCENAYTNIVGGEPRCLMCLKAQVWARDVAGDCDAGGACSDLLWHVWRSAPFVLWLSLCDYSHYLSCFWLSQAHVGLPATHISDFSYHAWCIIWSAAIFGVEKQKRLVMSDVIYFLLASTAGAATHRQEMRLGIRKQKLRRF